MNNIQGISYTVYVEKDTAQLKARIWYDSIKVEYTHAICARELFRSGHMPVSVGILVYSSKYDIWVPIFEESLMLDERSDVLRRRHIDVACQETERQLHRNTEVKQQLASVFDGYLKNEERRRIAQNMPQVNIDAHLENLRSNPYV